MTSRQVLVLHTVIFVIFAIGAICSPLFAIVYPNFFSSGFFIPSAGLFMVLVIASWPLFGGCPFTVWENKMRRKENLPIYEGSCIPRYAESWLGLSWSPRVFSSILVLLLMIPLGVGIVEKYL